MNNVTQETFVEVFDGRQLLLLHRNSAFALLTAYGLQLLPSQDVLLSQKPQHDLLCFGLGEALSFRG